MQIKSKYFCVCSFARGQLVPRHKSSIKIPAGISAFKLAPSNNFYLPDKTLQPCDRLHHRNKTPLKTVMFIIKMKMDLHFY